MTPSSSSLCARRPPQTTTRRPLLSPLLALSSRTHPHPPTPTRTHPHAHRTPINDHSPPRDPRAGSRGWGRECLKCVVFRAGPAGLGQKVCGLYWYSVSDYCRRCSLAIECVLLRERGSCTGTRPVPVIFAGTCASTMHFHIFQMHFQRFQMHFQRFQMHSRPQAVLHLFDKCAFDYFKWSPYSAPLKFVDRISCSTRARTHTHTHTYTQKLSGTSARWVWRIAVHTYLYISLYLYICIYRYACAHT